MYPAMQIYHLNLKKMSRTCCYQLRKSGEFFCGGAIFFADTVEPAVDPIRGWMLTSIIQD
jgi:hypothetical protein